MKHVQHVRGRWIARMTVPDELRAILNMRELVAPLGTDKKQAERQALAVLNRFHAILDEAREAYAANRPTLSSAAKMHDRQELDADDIGRAAPADVRDVIVQHLRQPSSSRRCWSARPGGGRSADRLCG